MGEQSRMLTVKAAADQTGLTVKGVRFYEKIGLIKPAERSPAGYRLYSEEDIARLHKIHFYREQQFSLEDIAVLLNDPDVDLRSYLKRQLFDIESRIQELEHVRITLNKALEENDCGEVLEEESRSSMARSRVAVVGIDLQNDFLDGGALPCRRIYNIIEPLRAFFAQAREASLPVVYVCDSHHRNDPELEIWQDHAIEGTWGVKIISELAPEPRDYVLKKNYFNGFIGTKLQNTLKKLGADTIILVGWRTHVCVAQTAIEAFHRGYRVLIAEDCVDSTTQVEHEFGLNLLRVNYGIEVLSSRDLLRYLAESTGEERMPGGPERF